MARLDHQTGWGETNPVSRGLIIQMTPDEREQMAILCQRIAVEQDRDKFTDLVDQLNELLEHKERRLNNPSQSHPSAAVRLPDPASGDKH